MQRIVAPNALWFFIMDFLELSARIKELRKIAGESQQAFATRLGISIRALANYEKSKVPGAKALIQLANAALALKEMEMAEAFFGELAIQTGGDTDVALALSIATRVLSICGSVDDLQRYGGLDRVQEALVEKIATDIKRLAALTGTHPAFRTIEISDGLNST
jgi:transcriptional regulator with XRE-family HTH domain